MRDSWQKETNSIITPSSTLSTIKKKVLALDILWVHLGRRGKEAIKIDGWAAVLPIAKPQVNMASDHVGKYFHGHSKIYTTGGVWQAVLLPNMTHVSEQGHTATARQPCVMLAVVEWCSRLSVARRCHITSKMPLKGNSMQIHFRRKKTLFKPKSTVVNSHKSSNLTPRYSQQ